MVHSRTKIPTTPRQNPQTSKTAFKLLRVALLLVTAAFDVWGFCLGVVGIFILLCTTKPLVGKGYLYPLVPFNGKALLRLLVREPISRDNT